MQRFLSTHFNRPPRIQNPGLILKDQLCDACKGINIETLASPGPYEHSPGFSSLSPETCALCDMIASRLRWHPLYMGFLPTGPVYMTLLYDSEKPGSVYLDVKCNGDNDTRPTNVPLRLPIMTLDGDIAQEHPYWLTGFRQPSSTDSDRSFETIRGWLKECTLGHDCSRPIWEHREPYGPRTTGTRYDYVVDEFLNSRPGRLIDLRAWGSESEDAKLVNSDTDFGHYAALSHCWGSNLSARYCTTTGNYLDRASRILFHELTKTFQDAFVIARRLGLRYLWIDSICILQDSKEDWEMESAKMGSVYSNAYLTIAADSSKDGNGGCFSQDCVEQLSNSKMFRIESSLREGTSSTLLIQDDNVPSYFPQAVEGGVLSSRAWTCQERVLSRRILHYTKQQLFWECRNSCSAEDRFTLWSASPGERLQPLCAAIPVLRRRVQAEIDMSEMKLSVQSVKQLMNKQHTAVEQVLSASPAFESPTRHIIAFWYDTFLSECYIPRKISFESDKLPAIAGIARVINMDLKSSYLAGMWLHMIEYGLCWYRVGPVVTPPAQYRGPSWSWASQNFHVHWVDLSEPDVQPGLGPQFSHIKEPSFSVDKATADEYGAVTGGFLQMNVFQRKVKLRRKSGGLESPGSQDASYDHESPIQEETTRSNKDSEPWTLEWEDTSFPNPSHGVRPGRIVLDAEYDESSLPQSVFFVRLLSNFMQARTSGILVEQITSSSETFYRRIGFAQFSYPMFNEDWFGDVQAETVKVI